MSALRDSRLKLARAQEHLDALRTSIERWKNDNPYRFVPEPDGGPRDFVLRAYIAHHPRDDEWSLLVGDFAHNARSALSVAAFHFADGKPSRLRMVEFPISRSPDEYANAVDRLIGPLPVAKRAIIERHQPYKRSDPPDDDPLFILHELNRVDKHQAITFVGGFTRFGGLGLGAPQGGGDGVMNIHIKHINIGPIAEDGAPLVTFALLGPNRMSMKPNITPEVQFGKGVDAAQGRDALPTLELILRRVEEVISDLEVD